MRYFSLFLASGILWGTTWAIASPHYPWDNDNCERISQNDGKVIGAACSVFDTTQGLESIDVYYHGGYLLDQPNSYANFYSNMAVDGSPFFRRRPLKMTTFGEGKNLAKKQALFVRYFAVSHFQQGLDFPKDKEFKINFQAERKVPTRDGVFAFDDSFKNNYAGKIKPVQY